MQSTSNQSSNSSRLVLCNCPKCNGKLIDPHTKVIHDLSNELSEISIESFQNRQEIEEIDESSSSKSTTLTQDVNLLEIEKDDIPNLTFLSRIRPKRHTNQPISVEISNIIADNEVLNISSEDEMEEMEEISIENVVQPFVEKNLKKIENKIGFNNDSDSEEIAETFERKRKNQMNDDTELPTLGETQARLEKVINKKKIKQTVTLRKSLKKDDNGDDDDDYNNNNNNNDYNNDDYNNNNYDYNDYNNNNVNNEDDFQIIEDDRRFTNN
ncbi:hypothetical protein Glove_4g10 [Diversispora epigaea]|uniref:Uncharacterized protein n=1 Tax=Diversispora epigaea TaxID=1348612 RepID=A0A397JPD3_9GLOM|nr:hypothetical protein Glove_4g10 [Diversispora epigaea]